ncbi:protein quiver-like [Argiope bruennichi]|uniref:UPAR/Ly6 domain-containing protein qvr n=1 Tax=Argiope bruennichi TaxID=94029 RepID=A0A8T0FS30_ARGBR|nr:protein quiver-like [Argiope bruennichi]KAF8793957.1 Protein quiver like protein [Argiope bruennichi]
MIRYRDMFFVQSVAVVIVLFILSKSAGEEECLSGKTYWCFECDTWSDPRCQDPFNWTSSPSELPTLKQCDGCCVKIVTNYSKPNESIRRTCTKNIRINLFMVDHVCMYEGHKTGHMCFCEGDQCNVGPSIRPPPYFKAILLIFACAVALRGWITGHTLL